MQPESTDEELMLAYAAGHAAAFDMLYARHKGGVLRFMLRQVRERALAEELFQDVWMNLINARARYSVQAKFSTYLYTLARNRLLDHFRRQRGVVMLSLSPAEEDDPLAGVVEEPAASAAEAPEARVLGQQQLAQLVRLVEALPHAQREAFLLHEEAGLDVDEIAQVTGSNREAAKSRLRYAVSKLKTGMKEYL